MHSLTKMLLKPLPVESRVVSQVLQPVYNSRELRQTIGEKFKVYREMAPSNGYLSLVERPRFRFRLNAAAVAPRLVSAIPRNDPLRPVPKGITLEKVWMLMAYLCELGPVDASIAAVAPIPMGNHYYAACWGTTALYGRHLYLVRNPTQHADLRAMVNNALMLISQPADE